MSERIAVSKNFFLDEFVDPMTYFKTPDHGLSKVNPKAFAIAQLFRELVGKSCFINNWWPYYEEHKNTLSIDKIIEDITKGAFSDWCGLRTDRCTQGAPASAHRILKGKTHNDGGTDLHVSGMSGAQMYAIVKANAKKFHELGLRRMEHPNDTPGWLHFDCREHEKSADSIKIVTPKAVAGYEKI